MSRLSRARVLQDSVLKAKDILWIKHILSAICSAVAAPEGYGLRLLLETNTNATLSHMAVMHTTMRGTINTAVLSEEFSHSLGIQSAGTEQQVAEALVAAWRTLWGTAATGIGTAFTPGVTYTEATAAKVLDPMVPDLGAAFHASFGTPLPGRGTGKQLPSQNAVAVSLTAGNRPNGRPFKGRFYLPCVDSNAIDQDGRLPTATTANLAAGFKTFFDTLNAAGHVVSIWSRTVEDLVGVVNLVRVGNKIDTIRSRRNDLPEVYSSQAIVGPQ